MTVWSAGSVLHLVTDASGVVSTQVAQGELYAAASGTDGLEGVAPQAPGRYRRMRGDVAVTIVLAPMIDLAGTVVDEAGDPVDGARIEVVDVLSMGRVGRSGEAVLPPMPERRPDTVAAGEPFTGPDGRFHLRVRAPTRPFVLASARGTALSFASASSVASGGHAEVHLRLHAGMHVRATCTTSDGAPVAHRDVALTPTTGGSGFWVTTDDAGVVDVGPLPASPRWELSAIAGWPPILVEPVALPEDGTPTRVVAMHGGTIGVDVSSTLAASYDLLVYACPTGAARPRACTSGRVTVGARGTARALVGPLHPGRHRVWVTGLAGAGAPGILVGAGVVDVADAQTTSVAASLAGLQRVAVRGPGSRFSSDTAQLVADGLSVGVPRLPRSDWLIGGDVGDAQLVGATRDPKGHTYRYTLALGRPLPASIVVGSAP